MSSPLNVFGIQFKGHHLVEAAAGTGKTYNITALYVRALLERNLKPFQLLVLTFTNDATAELKQRIRTRLQDIIIAKESGKQSDDFVNQIANTINKSQLNHLRECLFQFDEAAISTIHGFCQKILSEHHLDFKVSSNLKLETDINSLILEAADEFWDQFFFKSDLRSNFEKWYSNQLNLKFQSPDKLLETILPLILNPDIEVFQADTSFKTLENHYETTKEQFCSLKKLYESEKVKFLPFYNSDALNRKSFSDKKSILEDFEDWLSQDTDCPPFYNKLKVFGSDLPNKLTKKDYQAPDLQFYAAVDCYIQSYEKLNHIEIVFESIATLRIREIVYELKKKRGVLGYQDLLSSVRNGLDSTSIIRKKLVKRFPIAFIDEFQDTDHIQYSIFKSIYYDQRDGCLIMIGDPKQAIYRFRGADLNTYLAAKNMTSNENVYSLSHNYRSSKKMIKAVNSFFNGVNDPFLMNDLNFESAHFPNTREDSLVTLNDTEIAPCILVELNTNEKQIDEIRLEIANSVASEIVQLLQNDLKINTSSASQNDIAVLVDTHRNAELIQDILWGYGLRSTIHSKSSVFQSEESSDLFKILHAIASPQSTGYTKSALLTKMIDYVARDLLKMESTSKEWIRIEALIIELNNNWLNEGLETVFIRLESDFNLLRNLAKSENPERSITNYKHLKELLLQASNENAHSINGLLRYFGNKREEVHSNAPDEEVVRLESDDNLIQIVTHHSSKGLEYPIVFCPFLWNFSIRSPKIPIHSDGLSQTAYLDNKSDVYSDVLSAFKSEDKAEKIRLAYVAVTRAKAMCYIYHNNGADLKRNTGFNAIHHLMTGNHLLKEMIVDKECIETKKVVINNSRLNINQEGLLKSVKTDTFSREDLDSFNRWFSFSSLSHHKTDEYTSDAWGFDFDEDERHDAETSILKADKFNLPKGKNTGNLLHSIFEQIDFSDVSTFSKVIDEQMDFHGFESKWRSCVHQVVTESVKHILVSDISLSQIENSNRLVEMEFNFPLIEMDSKKLFQAIDSRLDTHLKIHTGFMKGFIDLIFRKDGKYFILDYKSNHLGETYSSYSQDALLAEMNNSKYNLQYHIYLIAFLRYIRIKKPDFDYDSEFGGVIYLFLRGVDPTKPGSGVYHHKPNVDVVEKLDQIMYGVEVL